MLARALKAVRDGTSGAGLPADDLSAVLRQFESDRAARILPLTLRSHAFGRLLQLPFPPVGVPGNRKPGVPRRCCRFHVATKSALARLGRPLVAAGGPGLARILDRLSSRGHAVLQSVIAGYDMRLSDAVHLCVHSFLEVIAEPCTETKCTSASSGQMGQKRKKKKKARKGANFVWGRKRGNRQRSDLSSRTHPGAGVHGAEPLRGKGFQPVALPGPCSIRLRHPRLSKARAHDSSAVRESHVLSEWLRRRLQAAAAQPILQISTFEDERV